MNKKTRHIETGLIAVTTLVSVALFQNLFIF